MKYKDKVKSAKESIKCWHEAWDGKIYISFSGGKDSTVLLHLVRLMYPNAKAMFINTGLEYPENVRFVKEQKNVDIIRPAIPFHFVLKKYGYPVISKEQSQFIYEARNTKSEKLRNIRLNGNKWNRGKISNKWKYLLNAPFKISEKCCTIMKKNPAKKYEKETGLMPLIGSMASESAFRMQNYKRYGCNAYELKRPISKPLSTWTDKDIWKYIKKNNISYSKIYDMGYTRTGCMFCMYGVHLEQGKNRFQLMRKTHKKQWKFCMKKLGLKKILKTIEVKRK